MNAKELIQAVKPNAGHIRADGPDLVITPRSAAAPVRAQLVDHKREIIKLLSCVRRCLGVRLVSSLLKSAPVQLPRSPTVTNVEGVINSTLVLLNAQLRREHWLPGNWGLSGLLASLEAVAVVVALDDPARALQFANPVAAEAYARQVFGGDKMEEPE